MKKIVLIITEDSNELLDVELDYKGYNKFEALEIIQETKEGLLEELIRLN